MTMHRDRYLAGAAFFVGVVARRGGRTFRVFDRTKRWRSVAQAMARAGHPPRMIAITLRRPPSAVERALSFGWRFGGR